MFAAASPAAGGAACFVAPVCGAACAVRSGAPARRSPDRRADERSSAAPARQHTRRSRAPPRRVFASARRSRRAALVDGTAPHPGRVRAVRSCARRKHVFPGDFFVATGAAAMRGNAAAARGVGGTRAGVDRRALARACASRAADSHEGEPAGAERQKKVRAVSRKSACATRNRTGRAEGIFSSSDDRRTRLRSARRMRCVLAKIFAAISSSALKPAPGLAFSAIEKKLPRTIRIRAWICRACRRRVRDGVEAGRPEGKIGGVVDSAKKRD
ncbi:hypothetical protein ABU614_00220 [Lysobacter firmicutimachus]|uniref:Uncharacterized protein n=1 Tax=Lysobacter firmicutimachus TaxID=1792846 RepID=A0AAU8MSI2_9GAMM